MSPAISGQHDKATNVAQADVVTSRPAEIAASPTNIASSPRKLDAAAGSHHNDDGQKTATLASAHIRARNRRKRYLDMNPEYFSQLLEVTGLFSELHHISYSSHSIFSPELDSLRLGRSNAGISQATLTRRVADTSLYEHLIQTATRCETHWLSHNSSILEGNSTPSAAMTEAPHQIKAPAALESKEWSGAGCSGEGSKDISLDEEEARVKRWVKEMTIRFLNGDDLDLGETGYREIDENDELDDWTEMERDLEEDYFQAEQPTWIGNVSGETGVQDF